MMKEDKLPSENIREIETPDYHDGDFDLGVWQEEIPEMIRDDEDINAK